MFLEILYIPWLGEDKVIRDFKYTALRENVCC